MARGIFSRMADIVKANVNDLVTRAEDPEKMIRQMILEMEEAVNKATASVGTAVANEKRLERQCFEKQDQIEAWQRKAELAVQSGEDDLARRALERRAAIQEAARDLEAALEESQKTSTQLKQQLTQLKGKLDEARTRQVALVARRRAAEARKQIAKGMSGVGDDAFSSFDRFRQRIETEEAEADAHQAMAGADPSLEEAFTKLERKGSVEDELQALKNKLGQKMGDLEKIADEIARKIDRVVSDVENKVRNKWKGSWKSEFNRTSHEFHSKTSNIRKMPDRLSDLATDGGCAMRYLLAYGLKSIAFCMGLGGLIAAATAIADTHPDWEQLTAGLSLLLAAQFLWWGGNRIKRSAEKRAYVRDQNRIIRLARDKSGSLTVLETATETRMAVEKADEILRELAVMGHAEMRISDSGMVVYHFPEIERWDEKHWAKPVDEL